VAAAAAGAAIVIGPSGGNLGQILKAAAIAGATAFAFNEVGDLTTHNPSFGTPQYVENVAGHALVGCASSAASGGSCESGALSGAVTAAAGPFINRQRYGAALVENAVLGGVTSVAGGGKFANGAITGAFGYMFNSAASAFVGMRIGGAVAGVVFSETGPLDVALAWAGATIGAIIGDWAGGPDIVYSAPNPNGRNGSPEHQANVEDLERDMQSRGLDTEREVYVPTPDGEKSSRYIDIVGKDPLSQRVQESYQVGLQTQAGNPIAREMRALDDIQKAIGSRPTFRPYN
jgi:hypothetical protein